MSYNIGLFCMCDVCERVQGHVHAIVYMWRSENMWESFLFLASSAIWGRGWLLRKRQFIVSATSDTIQAFKLRVQKGWGSYGRTGTKRKPTLNSQVLGSRKPKSR